jgi:multidrug resistance efflux pump
MGNPASVTRKKTEKRRKKYEQRLGPGVYLPKDQREAVNAAVKKAEAETKAHAEKAKKAREAKKKEKKAAKPVTAEKPAPAAKEEKK